MVTDGMAKTRLAYIQQKLVLFLLPGTVEVSKVRQRKVIVCVGFVGLYRLEGSEMTALAMANSPAEGGGDRVREQLGQCALLTLHELSVMFPGFMGILLFLRPGCWDREVHRYHRQCMLLQPLTLRLETRKAY